MSAWEAEDVFSILSGVFDLNAKLVAIGEDLTAVRRLLEDEDDEEEAPEDT